MPYQIISGQSNQLNNVFNNIGYDVAFTSNTPFNTLYNTTTVVFNKLKNLLLTRKGERILQPEFGTDLFKVIFEVSSRELQQQIEDYIIPDISYWVPEVTVTSIDVKTIEDDPTLEHTIQLAINYTNNGINTNSITLGINDSGLVVITNGNGQ